MGLHEHLLRRPPRRPSGSVLAVAARPWIGPCRGSQSAIRLRDDEALRPTPHSGQARRNSGGGARVRGEACRRTGPRRPASDTHTILENAARGTISRAVYFALSNGRGSPLSDTWPHCGITKAWYPKTASAIISLTSTELSQDSLVRHDVHKWNGHNPHRLYRQAMSRWG
jgi:hypothetical protein